MLPPDPHSTFAVHEDGVRDGCVVIVRGREPQPLLIASFKGVRYRRPALWRWLPTLGFRQMMDKVTTSPFGTARETSEEPWQSEDGEKCEKNEKEDGNVRTKRASLKGWA
jgi:hypothetical protein